jgi:hypothetical protein
LPTGSDGTVARSNVETLVHSAYHPEWLGRVYDIVVRGLQGCLPDTMIGGSANSSLSAAGAYCVAGDDPKTFEGIFRSLHKRRARGRG